MTKEANLISAGARMVARNKRYVLWFYLLNLVLASFGAAGFITHARSILDHSLYADRILHGFDVVVLFEMLARPEMGPGSSWTMPSLYAALLFFGLSFLFMPGVLRGYACGERLPRDEFFQACGRNVWRFARLLVFYAIFGVILAGMLFGIQAALVKAADKASYEKLPFYTQLAGLSMIFLVMTTIRASFDVAQTDVVLSDQNRVRSSMRAAFRNVRQRLPRLLGSYVCIAIVAMIVLAGGFGLWHWLVPAGSVLAAFLVGQLTLLGLLAARFWQRASAVVFHQRYMSEHVEIQPAPSDSVPSAASPAVRP